MNNWILLSVLFTFINLIDWSIFLRMLNLFNAKMLYDYKTGTIINSHRFLRRKLYHRDDFFINNSDTYFRQISLHRLLINIPITILNANEKYACMHAYKINCVRSYSISSECQLVVRHTKTLELNSNQAFWLSG